MAADNGDVDDVRTFLQIIDHYDIDVDNDERIKYCKKCADMGDERSMYEYATEIYNDNPEERAHYYKLSAENGYIKAYSEYGLMLRLCIGVTADKKEASNYFIKGHEEGNVESSYYAAEMLFIGDGIDADIEKSRELLKKILKMSILNHVFYMHSSLLNWKAKMLIKVKRNIKESIRLYKEASLFNNQYAKNNLGVLIKYGFGDEVQPFDGAEVYFEEAINRKNDVIAMYNLSHISN